MSKLKTKYTINELKEAATLATEAYGDSIPGATKFENKRTGAACFVLYRNKSQYLIWRGTNSFIDWVWNLTAGIWKVNGRWVHLGFYLHHRSLFAKARAKLDPQKKTYIIGHSLGGSCATISALRLAGEAQSDKGFNDLRLLTFGRPNVMKKSNKKIEGLTYDVSIVAGSDIVCTVPRLFFGSDAGSEIIFLANDKKDYFCPSKDFRDKDRRGELDELISDHFMDTSYIPRVKKLKMESLICDQE